MPRFPLFFKIQFQLHEDIFINASGAFIDALIGGVIVSNWVYDINKDSTHGSLDIFVSKLGKCS